jgi:DDE superfamily endonuclease
VNVAEMGPVAAKSDPGPEAVDVQARPAQRARQEIDYGRRAKGYVVGALWETTGDCWTPCYPRRSKAHCIDVRCWVDQQLPPDKQRIYAILDNLGMRHGHDWLVLQIHPPRGEVVYQPKYAAYLNLIEPWWKILRSLALQGRRFETWDEVSTALAAATVYWQAHKHPFVWGRRRRHRPLSSAHSVSFTTKVMRI